MQRKLKLFGCFQRAVLAVGLTFAVPSLVTIPSYAALPSSTAWEVRLGVGSDTTAGACFVTGSSGTDYSQQNGAQYTATDLAASGTTSIVVSVSHSFVATDVGNCIHITTTGTGGLFVIGYYEIVSVAAGLATLDRACASSAAAAGGTYYVGGAAATPANVNSNATASNQVWVKATGTYTVTSAMTITLNSSGAPSIPYSFIGYTTTRGDNGQFTWTTATNSVDPVDFSAAQNVVLQNIIMSSTAGTPGNGLNALSTGNSINVTVQNCKLSGFLNGILGNFSVDWAFAGLNLINSRITASTAVGLMNSASTYIQGSLLDNNASDGAQWNSNATSDSSSWFVENSIFYKNGGNGINIGAFGGGAPIFVVDHSDFSTNTSAGIKVTNTLVPTSMISNSIMDDNTGYGVDAGAGSFTMPWLGHNNAFYSNTAGPSRNVNAGIGTITLTASPYVSLGSLNFALNTTAGGGALLLNAGFPGVLTNGGGTGFAAVGALQPQTSTASSSRGFPIVQ